MTRIRTGHDNDASKWHIPDAMTDLCSLPESLIKAPWASFLQARRWYADRASDVEAVEPLHWISLGGDPEVAWAIVQVKTSDHCSLYGLPLLRLPANPANGSDRLCRTAENMEWCDAFARPERLAAALAASVRRPPEGLQVEVLPDMPPVTGWPLGQARPLSTEQSHTSMILGKEIYLKVYRKLEPGGALEWATARFLARKGSTAPVPKALCTWNAKLPDGLIVTLALAQKAVHEARDGWLFALDDLRSWLLHPESEGEEDRRWTSAWAQRLGRRVAQLHLELATMDAEPSWRPVPLSEEILERDGVRVRELATRAFDALKGVRLRLPTADLVFADKLLSGAATLINSWSSPPSVDPRTLAFRNHGDLHLGQLLVKAGDFTFVDFEGEPGRSRAERVLPRSGTRDVACMLRSFDYAAWTVVREGNLGDALPLARRWRLAVESSFLEGYLAEIAGRPLAPIDAGEWSALVVFYMREKALYELLYELDHRPDWAGIPLRGLAELEFTSTIGASL